MEITAILGVVGLLAFIINVITQLTKEIGFLSRIPTALQVIVTSLIICLLAYFGYSTYAELAIQWYYIVATIIGSFIVAYVSMYGFEKLKEIYNRFRWEE